MLKSAREFQVFVKPIGYICNLGCRYCYYLKTEELYPEEDSFRMSDEILENYIIQHINASSSSSTRFSWHGGEPTLLGLDYFKKIVEIQNKNNASNQLIYNGIQTNGSLLDEDWCRFFSKEGFDVGLSLDGPKEIHNRYRKTKKKKPTHYKAMRGYRLLKKYRIYTDILCVVNAYNVQFPLEVYRFFKKIDAQYLTFLPLVELKSGSRCEVSEISVSTEDWGKFLCTIFDEWKRQDIGRIKIQIFEEATRTAFNQEHSLCIFRPTCGDIPVVEHNGDFYSCDHFVNNEYLVGNIMETPLLELLESHKQRTFGNTKIDTLPDYCLRCSVLSMCNGECPKNRFIKTPSGESGLNYLCAGYKRFFEHCQPFITEVANLWKKQNPI